MVRRFGILAVLVAGCGSVVSPAGSSSSVGSSTTGAAGGHGEADGGTGAGGKGGSSGDGGSPAGGAAGGGAGGADAGTGGAAGGGTSGEGGGTGGGDGGSVGDVDAFCSAFATWYCGLAVACGCTTTSGWPGSSSACGELLTGDCLWSWNHLQASGQVFRSDHANACLAALEAAGTRPCIEADSLTSAFYTCSMATASTTPLGAACSVPGGECASGDGICMGGVCVTHPGIGQKCPQPGPRVGCPLGSVCNASSVCQLLGGQGAACKSADDCAVGLVCNGAGACAAPLAAGAACTANDACGLGLHCTSGTCQPSPATCTWYGDCGSQYIMDCRLAYAPVCTAGLGLNGDCGFAQSPCMDGLSCMTNFGGGSCQPQPGAGQACISEGSCQPGLGCDVFGTHVCQPPAAAGTPCNVGPVAVQCAMGSACTDPGQSDGVCVAVSGPACVVDADCSATERCSAAGVCRAPVPVATFCDAGTPCVVGAVCEASLCRQVVGAGAACPDDFTTCDAGLACVQGTEPGHGTCQATPGAGQSCLIDGRCSAGLTCFANPDPFGVCEPTVCMQGGFPL